MFGYVQAFRPELKVKEAEQYRGVYCTLCKRLGKRYGLLARFTLNYDFTFLALLQMALEDPEITFKNSRCTFMPTRRCLRCQQTQALDRAADIAMLMFYSKCRDDRTDGRFWRRVGATVLQGLFARAYRKAKKAQPEAAVAMENYMTAQQTVERENTSSVDAAAEPTAKLMATLLAALAADERSERVLSRFGYCLGRWVYLADAVDDLETDRKTGNFNPYWLTADGADIAALRERGTASLNISLGECIAAYELLTVHRFDGILRNILTQGMPLVGRQLITPHKKGETI
ncbi:MAG: hypothetical protein IJF42_04080 [Clostridia bacterium]|nr:hypothetical protein [Clostridia bacterium]